VRGAGQCKYGLSGGSEPGYGGSRLSSQAHQAAVPVCGAGWGGAQTQDRGGVGQAGGIGGPRDNRRGQKGGD